MTQTWRDAIESDPLNLATHREWQPPEGTPETVKRSDLWRLLVTVALIIALAYASGYGETVLLVIALIACVVAHELGHYIAAKTGRVKVTEFFVGFGPKLWSVSRGETEYGVKGIPLGGYCRIIGMNSLEEVEPLDEARTYRRAPLWRRLLIDVGGPGMNFLVALLIFFAMFFWVGDNGNYLSPQIAANGRISAILRLASGESPAQVAGLRAGDRIEAIDGRQFASWAAMGKFIQASPGKPLALTVQRGGQLLNLRATPVAADTVHIAGDEGLPAGKAGFLGISMAAPVVHSSFASSLADAGGAVGRVTTGTFSALGHLFTLHGASSYLHMLSSQKAADSPDNTVRFASPVKVVQLFHQASGHGLATVLWLIAVINVSLGLLNLLPVFPLDGGRVVVALYEGIRGLWLRRPYRVDMAKLLPVLYAGLAFVTFIGITTLFLDLRDLAT